MLKHACRAVLFCSLGVLLAQAWPAPPQTQSAPQATFQDWKRLRKTAKTPEDLRTCAQWSRSQAGLYQKTLSQYEAELKAYQGRPANRQGPKYPPSVESLRSRIDYYQGQVKYWTDMAASYDTRANSAETSASKHEASLRSRVKYVEKFYAGTSTTTSASRSRARRFRAVAVPRLRQTLRTAAIPGGCAENLE